MARMKRSQIAVAAAVAVFGIGVAIAPPTQLTHASQPLQIYPTYTYPTPVPYPTIMPYPTAVVHPTLTFTTVPLPTATAVPTDTSTATPTATAVPTSTSTSTPTPTSTATPKPSITITATSVLHRVGGRWQRTVSVYQNEVVRFTLSASMSNPGENRPSARILISKGATTLHRGSMTAGTSRASHVFLTQYRFEGTAQLGKVSARFNVTLGPVTASRVMKLTVKTRR